jgi:hypothetical protein
VMAADQVPWFARGAWWFATIALAVFVIVAWSAVALGLIFGLQRLGAGDLSAPLFLGYGALTMWACRRFKL